VTAQERAAQFGDQFLLGVGIGTIAVPSMMLARFKRFSCPVACTLCRCRHKVHNAASRIMPHYRQTKELLGRSK
jgi:hypothetical protein